MKKKLDKVFDKFNKSEDNENTDKVVVISTGGEIIERVDKVFITESGKQLLRD